MAVDSAGRGAGARWIVAGSLVLLVAAAIGLWARHGAAVFFDTLAAGIAYCF